MTKRFQRVDKLSEFERDIKKLRKRFRTIDDDLATLIDTLLYASHTLGLPLDGVRRIDDLGHTRIPVFKARKFACKALKGKGSRTGLRLVYAYDAATDCIELIEIYLKSDKDTEDRRRIGKYYL